MLTASPDTLTSQVSLRDFRTVVSGLEGVSVTITKNNFGAPTRLCDDFQFGALSERLSQSGESDELKEEVTQKDLEARKRVSGPEE
jgi:hypothetical protein